jgi:hypothetical protein
MDAKRLKSIAAKGLLVFVLVLLLVSFLRIGFSIHGESRQRE